MPTEILIILCVGIVAVCASFTVTCYFIMQYAGKVARMNAANNIWEYQSLEKASQFGSRYVRKQVSEEEERRLEEERKSGQTQGDGTLSDDSLKALSAII